MQSVLSRNSKISFKSNLISITFYCSEDKKCNKTTFDVLKKKMIQQTEAGTEMFNFSWILAKITKELHL